MPNLTLTIPLELKKEMEKVPEMNWSEVVREFLSKKVERVLLLKKMDKILENSKLTESDCLELGEQLKGKMWKRYKKEGW